jgi:hypothetical protein
MSSNPTEQNSTGTVSLDDEDNVRRIVSDTLLGLWATVNDLSRLRPSKRSRYRVTVFGSARPRSRGHQNSSAMAAAMGCPVASS